jgi:hypothetical protein
MNVKRGLAKFLLMSAVSLFIFGLERSAAAQTWIELNPVGSPPNPVYDAKPAFYDAANNRLIVFFPGNPPFNGNPPGNGNEVWVLTDANGLGATPTWIKLLPSGSPPFTNGLVSVVYDQGSNRLTVYGGCFANCSPALSNVFVLTNANGLGGPPVWSQSTVTNPQARAGLTSVYDSANNLVIAFGGHLAFPGTVRNDTRLLSNANGAPSPSVWTSLGTSGGPPPIRSDHSAFYDQANNRMTIFGGDNAIRCCPWVQEDYNDAWVLSNANGQGGTPTWSPLSPLGTPPQARGYQSAVYDADNNRMLVFGGSHWDQTAQLGVVLGDLWQLSNANGIGGTPTWTQLPQLGTPPGPRSSHTAAFDAVNQRMILLGGRDSTDTPSNRVWILVFNNPPTAICQDVTVSAGPDCTANASIDNGSFDPDSGDTITLTQTPPGPYPLGTTSVTLTVTDSHGASSQCTGTVTVLAPQLAALGPAKVWLGLKNSDDVGTKFDLLAEVLKNGSPVASEQLNSVPGGSSGFNNAVLRTIDLALSTPVDVCSGDTLSIRLSVRIAVGVSGHRSGTARLWFNDAQANSRFDATIGGATSDYFLLNGFTLGAAAGPGPKKTIDVFVDRAVGGNPFKPFGTWSKTF